MRISGRGLVLFCALSGGAACSQVIGISDRMLRPEDAGTSDGAFPDGFGADGFGADDGGTDANAGDATAPSIDAGPQFVVFSASAIDFGLASCGAGGPPNRALTLTNTGGAPLTWSASLAATSVFAIVGSTAGTVSAHSFVTIALSAQGLPSYASPGATEQGTLTVVTNDPAHPTTDFLLKETAAGAALTLDPLTVAFGQVPLANQASDIPIVLRNTGNLSVALGFGTPSDPQFALLTDAGALLAPDATVSGLVGQFRPTGTTASSANVAIMASGAPMCGINPTNIRMTGQGTSSAFSIQPGSLDFGLVDCGGPAAAAKQVTVSTTGAAFSISAALTKGAASPYTFSITPAGPATSFAVVVTPNAVLNPSSVAADFFGDTLTITAPDGPHPITLLETAHGAILTSSTTGIAFGGVPTGNTATSPFTVKNHGNASATVSFTDTSAAFGVTPQGQIVGGAGGTSTTTVSFSPTTQSPYTGTATMTVPAGTVLCDALPPSIALTGTGTVNFVSVTPSNLDFGLVSCGTTASNKMITIQNTAPSGSASFDWTATLGKGAASPYGLNKAFGTVKASTSFTLLVSPAAVPQPSAVTPDLYGDTLTIHTTAPGDSDHVISLHETAQGVILAFNPVSINFGDVKLGTTTADPAGAFQVVNSGNIPASITLFSTDGQFQLDQNNATLNGGSAFATFLNFHPLVPTGPKSTNVSLASTAVNCGPAFPILFPVSGNAIP